MNMTALAYSTDSTIERPRPPDPELRRPNFAAPATLARPSIAAIVTSLHGRTGKTLLARVLAVMGLVGLGFLLFLLFTSNPFLRLLPAPPEGRDLNPLLQDPGMVIHPPMLYMGYVGFSVAFAFAIAALLGGRLDATWARWSRS